MSWEQKLKLIKKWNKNNKMTSFFKCRQPGCDLYLQTPVILPCGFTICDEHIAHDAIKFECQLCHVDHSLPDDGHFPLNKLVYQMIEANQHLKGNHQEVNGSFLKFEALVDDFKSIKKDTFSYDYFAKLRRKVDVHREELIKKLHDKSENIIDKIAQCENEFKKREQENENELGEIEDDKIKLDEKKINEWKNKLRKTNLDERDMEDLNDEINSMINLLTIQKDTYEKSLLNGFSFRFEPKNDETFGELIINNQNVALKRFHAYGHNDVISAVKIINGKLLTGSEDTTIKLWDLEKGSCLKTLTDHTGGIRCFEKLSNTKILSASYDNTIKIWNVTDNDICNFKTIVTKTKPNQICCYLDAYLFAADIKGYITCWNITDLNHIRLIGSFKAHITNILCLKAINNMRFISSSEGMISNEGTDLKIWQFGEELEQHFNPVCLHKIEFDYPVYGVEVKNLGDILTFTEYGDIKMWNTRNGRLKKSVFNHEGTECMKLIKNNRLAFVTFDNFDVKLHIHDFERNKQLEVLKSNKFERIHLLEELDNGNLIIIDKANNVDILDVDHVFE